EHVEESVHVRLVARDGILDRPRHGAERRLVQHAIHALAGLGADLGIADVSEEEAEAGSPLLAHRPDHLLDVLPEAGGEVVETDDLLVELEQHLHEVRSDEAGGAGHQPALRPLPQIPNHDVDLHHRLQYRRFEGIEAGSKALFTSMKIPPPRSMAPRAEAPMPSLIRRPARMTWG